MFDLDSPKTDSKVFQKLLIIYYVFYREAKIISK